MPSLQLLTVIEDKIISNVFRASNQSNNSRDHTFRNLGASRARMPRALRSLQSQRLITLHGFILRATIRFIIINESHRLSIGCGTKRAKQFSPRVFLADAAGDLREEEARGDAGAGHGVDSQSSLHRLYNEGSLRGGMKLNRRAECEVVARDGGTARRGGSPFLPTSRYQRIHRRQGGENLLAASQ